MDNNKVALNSQNCNIKYCQECGQKLELSMARGDKVEVNIYDSGGGTWRALCSPYNQETGELELVEILTCPNYKRTFWGSNWHDIYSFHKGYKEYGVRILK